MGNMKKTWQGINELLHRRKKNLQVIPALKDLNNRNKIVKKGSRIPNIINKHFATVGNRPANNLPIPHRSDEGLTLETSAFLPFTVANLRFQPSC